MLRGLTEIPSILIFTIVDHEFGYDMHELSWVTRNQLLSIK